MKIELNKKSKSVIAVYAILAVVYILGFIMIPFTKTAASWIEFFFTIVALAGSLIVCGYAFSTKDTIVSKIYGFPIFRVGAIYAIAQFVIGIIICIISAIVAVPYWIAMLLSVLLLAAAAIGVIATDNSRDIIESIDDRDQEMTEKVTCFQINIAGIVDDCEEPALKSELEKLNELLTYSDPVSNEKTKAIESEIDSALAELKKLVANGSAEDISALIKKITNTLNERNRICKAYKK